MNDTPKDDNNSKTIAATNMTARSKVMQNWSSSWSTITPVPVMPAEELPRVASRKKCNHNSSAKNDDSVKNVKKTKEITTLLSVKISAKRNKPNSNKNIDNLINNNTDSKFTNDESNSNESDIKSDTNKNTSDCAAIYKNLRKRKSIEVIDEDRKSINSNNMHNNECEPQTGGNKVLKIDINATVISNDEKNNNLDINDIYESFQTCCIFHYPLTHPLPFPTLLSFPSISFGSKTTRSESQIKAQKAVKKSRLIQAQKKRRKKTFAKALQLLTFTKPSVRIVEYEGAFKEFVSQKFAIQEKTPFFQDRSCTNCPHGVSQCLDCISVNEKNGVNGFVDSQTCRFYQYRTLIKKDGNLMVYAFAEEGNATPEDTQIWLPSNSSNSRSNLDEMTAKFLLTWVSEQFCQIYMEEFAVMGCATITWKKPVKGVRELCDLCSTTIFNTHWVCPVCGYAVCIDCFQWRSDLESQSSLSEEKRRVDWRREVRDEYNWLFCSTRERHSLTNFHLALFITKAVFASLNTSMHMTRNRLEIRGKCLCGDIEESLRTDFKSMIPSVSDLKSLYAHIPHQWFCENRLLVLNEPRNADNIKLFQIHWIRGDPVMVENVNDSLDADLWTPNAFNRDFGKQMSRLVNCMNGAIIPKKPMKYFWDGFEDMSVRMKDQETGEEMLLKLKDWPPNAEFRDKLPKRFHNLMDCLPLPEYTRYDGIRNLSTRLPEFFVRPDLGPKMYCAYGSVKHSDKGTTNLHLDMSDAINVMIYVGIALSSDGETLEDYRRESMESLIAGGCDEEMIERVRHKRVGALWHIFPAKDANKIRQFLTTIAMERGMKLEVNNDPIHDQCWYLDESLRQRLLHSYGVRGLAIGQCLGDAILIPAGAPHQVRNLNSCIKVAGEFVSPENVEHCLSLTQEFRKLSRRHNNHEDKLQIKNIIYHTVKDAIAVLLPHQ